MSADKRLAPAFRQVSPKSATLNPSRESDAAAGTLARRGLARGDERLPQGVIVKLAFELSRASSTPPAS